MALAGYTVGVKQTSYTLFDSPIGTCAIAWRASGGRCTITHLQLPESTPQETEQRIARQSGGVPGNPPSVIAGVIEKVRKHLGGELQEFREVPLDLSGVGEFDRSVYEAAMRIPPGETRTYGELGKLVSQSFPPLTSNLQLPISRAVGQALARNPIPLIIPCHRVLAANGRLGGFSAPGALHTKTKLLSIEGAKFPTLLGFPS